MSEFPLADFTCSTCGFAANVHVKGQHKPTRYCRVHEVKYTPPGLCSGCWKREHDP